MSLFCNDAIHCNFAINLFAVRSPVKGADLTSSANLDLGPGEPA